MKISEFLATTDVVSELTGSNSANVLAELCRPIAASNGLNSQVLVASLLERERVASTGIGDGVAIPHTRVSGLSELRACVGRSKMGIDFNSIDSKPSHLFVALFAPTTSPGIHLHALSRICRIFKNPALRDALMQARDATEIYQLIEAEDALA